MQVGGNNSTNRNLFINFDVNSDIQLNVDGVKCTVANDACGTDEDLPFRAINWGNQLNFMHNGKSFEFTKIGTMYVEDLRAYNLGFRLLLKNGTMEGGEATLLNGEIYGDTHSELIDPESGGGRLLYVGADASTSLTLTFS